MSSRRASVGPRSAPGERFVRALWRASVIGRAAVAMAIGSSIAYPPPALAQPKPTAGYPEPIVQWGVGRKESCDDIARAVYGSAEHVGLLMRYNRIVCLRGAPLREGLTLVLPATVTQVPSAQLTSVNPQVEARPPGGGWSTAGAGQPLSTNSSVHTFERGRAGIQFVDRTRVYMASNTLVVIYGTASQTAVSKVPPPAVELETGEVQAGLAALRGDTVDVTLAGGGRVSAASRDTVVARKGDRTTVAVFDGKADVTSGGASVNVPASFGTDFRQGRAPSPPRPLPPAPSWLDGGSPSVVLSAVGEGRLEARWEAVPRAVGYRFEVSRDPDFGELVVREEIPGDTRAFRGEQLPTGSYYLRVRAIDDEQFLGLASATRAIELVAVRLGAGRGQVAGERIVVSPGGRLALEASDRVELAIDSGPFGPMPSEIDLARIAPHELRFRARGAEASHTVTVEYLTPPTAEPVAPMVPSVGAPPDRAVPPPRAPPVPVPARPLVPAMPMVALSCHANVLWFSPTAATAAVASGTLGLEPADELGLAGQAMATGALGPVGLEAQLRTGSAPGDELADTNAWLGARWRIHRFEPGGFELGPGLRLSLPVSAASAPAQLEPAFAFGGRLDRWSLVANLGTRVRLHSSAERIPVDPVAPFVLFGTMVDVTSFFQAYALLDAHLFVGDYERAATGGVSLGLEVGEKLFGGFGARLAPPRSQSDSPWSLHATDGLFSMQASIGVRDWSTTP